MPNPLIQHQQSVIGGLQHALSVALSAVAVDRGKEARATLETLRDKVIKGMKNSDIDPRWEMQHSNIVRPAIEAIQAAFDEAIRNLNN